MKKIIILTLYFMALLQNLHAQNVGINNPTPAASAVLDITSTDKGLLLPRLTTLQRTSVLSPAYGLMVCDTTLNAFYFWDKTTWRPFLTNLSGWQTKGNAGTNPAVNFIGTTDNQPLKFRVWNSPAGSIQTDGQTFIGLSAGQNNTGLGNTAFGGYALQANTSGQNNSAFGINALYFNTTGESNVAAGAFAMFQNSTGFDNVGIGHGVMSSNSTGSYNTAIGYGCAQGNTTGEKNSAMGQGAMLGISTASENTAIGTNALSTQSFSNGNTKWVSYNVAIGSDALLFNQPVSTTTGNKNTGVGHSSLKNNTSGSANTAIGYNAGLNNNTGINNTFLGTNSSPSSSTNNSTTIGYGAGGTSNSNRIDVGNTSVTWIGGQVNWATYSDGRIKNNVQQDVVGLDFINKLNPVTYNYNIHRSNEMRGIKDSTEWKEKYDIEKMRFSGFIAQQVEEAAVKTGYDFSGVVKPQNNNDLYSIRYAEFVVPLVKSVQELSAQNIALKSESADQKKIISDLLDRVLILESQIK